MNKLFLEENLADIRGKGLERALRLAEGPQGRKIRINGRDVLNFCSNNYLGLAGDARLARAAAEGMSREGFGAGASRLVCGNMSAHLQLEAKIARFKGAEESLLFSTGYMANVGILSSLFGRGDIIFSDRFNHASIIDGILLSQAKMKRYPHKDMGSLRKMLSEARGFRKRCIVTDSVFSMDGDIAPLDKIVSLAEEYDCWVMVDEAHAFGVLGEQGKGAVELFGLEDKIDIQMGTLSKAAGCFGAYCCGSRNLIKFLMNRARSFIYTTGLPPGVAAAACRAIEIIEDEPQRRERLWENTRYMLNGLRRMGWETLDSQTPIIPVVVKDAGLAVTLSQRLLGEGVFISAIRPPTVPQNTSRLRVSVMATHEREDLNFVLDCLARIGEELCLFS
ncbi:MAG: 8-amino-7-oxononanoate synthase [Candidatus Omnitrophota bacterium]